MTEKYRINLSLLIIISFFLHIVFAVGLMMPDIKGVMSMKEKSGKSSRLMGRDIIVNINQDKKRVISRRTLLSDADSSARGHITDNKGDRWLNNSLEFKLGRGKSGRKGRTSVKQGKEKFILSDNSEVVASLHKQVPSSGLAGGGLSGRIAIPDKNSITLKNAIYYSNSGSFSFNTAKFKNFEYFKNMKDLIASNWYPPVMANAVFRGQSGSMRIMAIPSQRVKLYFVMNRSGDILDVKIVDSMGNQPLNSSCLDAVRLSKSFGKVPDDIKGELVMIPFIFGYFSN